MLQHPFFATTVHPVGLEQGIELLELVSGSGANRFARKANFIVARQIYARHCPHDTTGLTDTDWQTIGPQMRHETRHAFADTTGASYKPGDFHDGEMIMTRPEFR